MSEIALYNATTKLESEHDEAKEAVADVATKIDIVRVEETIAELEAKLTRQIYAVAGIIIEAVGLMIGAAGLIIGFFII